MAKRVIILGGGIGGLSAAHELIERGFDVEIYEALSIPGGKARSIPVPNTGKDGRKDLPGEHGFRFFPRFYKHVVDTMARIPYGSGRTVADNLIDTTRVQLCRFDRMSIELPTRSVRNMNDVRVVLEDLGHILGGDLGISQAELAFFAARIWQVLTSCNERRMTEYEKIPWWEFIGAEVRSEAYQKLLGHGITRSLVAAKANQASTKTIGDIFVQLLFDIATPGPSTDRVLNGPTNEVWIEPWLDYLKSRGLRYHTNAMVTKVELTNKRVSAIHTRINGSTRIVSGDYYVFALPVEDMAVLLTPEMLEADPGLGTLHQLDEITEWMNGIQIYLREDVKITHGHSILVDSPWALTSISQAQFWEGIDLSRYGDGDVRGIISVDISEWERKGLNGKTAKDCSAEELKNEVWEQLKRSLNHGDQITLRDDHLHQWFLDPSLQLREGDNDTNEEPLLVNLVDTWKLRPEAATRIPNMFLAADYVRTFTDLATMEAANEAARRAVNGILQVSAIREARCEIWPLHEAEIFMPWREMDRLRYERGLSWDGALVDVGLSLVKLLESTLTALGSNSPSDPLRRDGQALIERLMNVFAVRLAQGQSSSGTGRVRLIPQ